MINLLLPVDRKAVRAVYRHRLFVVGGLLTFGLALIALIIVSSFAFILSLRRGEVLGQIMIAKQQFSTDALAKVQQTVSEVNASINILGPVPGHESVADILKQLIDKRTAGIQLISFKFVAQENGTVEVAGKSQTRVALLAYLEALRAEPRFSKIESPVKNIIRERDVTFNLTVTMAPPK